jgi:hypothetical protein
MKENSKCFRYIVAAGGFLAFLVCLPYMFPSKFNHGNIFQTPVDVIPSFRPTLSPSSIVNQTNINASLLIPILPLLEEKIDLNTSLNTSLNTFNKTIIHSI